MKIFLYIVGIYIIISVLWMIYEFITAPTMPDEYDRIELK